MAMTLTQCQLGATITASTTWPIPATVTDATVRANRFAQQQQMLYQLTNGTATGKANATIFAIRQLAGAANEELNFFDGSVKTVDGGGLGLAKVKLFVLWQVANPDGAVDASSFTVGNASATQLVLNLGAAAQTFTGFLNAVPFWAGQPAGYTVDATHKLFKVTNDDATHKLTYMLFVEGNSN